MKILIIIVVDVTFDVCIIDFRQASCAKYLKSKKHLEKGKQNELILPEWLFQEPTEIKLKKLSISKTLPEKAREIIKKMISN